MGICTLIVVILVVCIVLYITALLLVDCDLGLAWATKMGNSVGELTGIISTVTL
jgi:hypothetical protein